MKKTILAALALTLAAGGLSACATYPVRERVVVEGRAGWVAGHYDRFGGWIPGHYR